VGLEPKLTAAKQQVALHIDAFDLILQRENGEVSGFGV